MPQDRRKTPLRDLATYGTKRAPRLDLYDYVADAVVHLTVCAHRGKPFATDRIAEMVCKDVEFYSDRLGFRLYGYCLMPDHLHALLSPADSGNSVSKWLQRFKSHSAHEASRLGHPPPLWQRSAHDHVCRRGETAVAVVSYIANNPVRAGLVECWQDWPWTRVFIEV